MAQVSKVTSMMASVPTSEKSLQSFLYELSFMNDMVVKGYCQERTMADCVIYATKSYACHWLMKNFNSRCVVYSDVLYVYANCRQYSYHLRNVHYKYWYNPCKRYFGDTSSEDSVVVRYKSVKWIGIEGAWALTDEEYKQQVKKEKKVEEVIPFTQTSKFINRLKDLKAKCEKERRIALYLERKERFFAEIAIRLPKVAKNKCYIRQDYNECIRRYADKADLKEYNNWSFANGYAA